MASQSAVAPTFTPADFEPVTAERRVQQITRPSLSYWQDAWRRLKANRRAIGSLYIVVALLIFTIAGPWVWQVDPAATDLDQVRKPPGTDRRAIIAEPYVPWPGATAAVPATAVADLGLRLAERATTQAVRLLWNPAPGAGYRVYRNVYDPGPEQRLGLPLADILNPTQVSFEDRLDLQPQRYFYSVRLLDRYGKEQGQASVVPVDVVRVITKEHAVERGLAASSDELALGSTVLLALHPLGTDGLGRDILARLMQGARVSLFIGIVAPFLYVTLGVLYGAVAGFLAGRVDQLLMRFADFVVALPFLLFMILLKIAFGIGPGDSGIFPLVLALVLLGWPNSARLVRGQILQLRQEGYINAARLLGARNRYLILRHMIPNTLGLILVTITFAVPVAIFTEAFLSFIGMGVAPPTPSWGSMCYDGTQTMLSTPHELIFPALMISIVVLAFNLLGDGLRDAFDARMRSRE